MVVITFPLPLDWPFEYVDAQYDSFLLYTHKPMDSPNQVLLYCIGACSSSVAYTPVPATVQNTHVETTAVKSQMLQNGRGGSAAVPVMARLQFAFWVPSRNNPSQ